MNLHAPSRTVLVEVVAPAVAPAPPVPAAPAPVAPRPVPALAGPPAPRP